MQVSLNRPYSFKRNVNTDNVQVKKGGGGGIDKVTMVGQQLLIKDEEADDNYLISLVIFYWVSYLQVKFNTS
jgi:hypothetical protein